MSVTHPARPMAPAPAPPPFAPPLPATGAEFINTLAHFHRAEMGRMAGWRDRIDRTTNWAITVVAGMLSVSLSTPSAHHGVLLFAMLLVLLLLVIEARRYRFFDVYRARVRQMERHYFAQVLSPRPDPAPDPAPAEGPNWAALLAEDLRHPNFLIGLPAAFSRRLRRNYIWMFLVLLLAWIIKISTASLQHDERAAAAHQSLPDLLLGLSLGPLPGWSVLAGVTLFYAWLIYAALRPPQHSGELAHGEVHV
ncbi:Hypothetical protein RMHFA_03418 [Roseomonas mucosa]|uniref:DUF2270 domain-containing protein n=1 Tax=Roseomonas TaxID=125216 RepID=UPI000C184C48|nr:MULTISPECIES: DUF2270 domain-containing protein [Roseomonas]ATR22756.1 hypothetical protein CTJ15_22220 [Roseomonas sp. FDAARGOS_362]MDT8276091.1 DUF2270 domain-containing protein [Roseomonas mucosa]UZO98469.1 Hypothetical protein RMHFA_03418 [Roseomonas mucosa]